MAKAKARKKKPAAARHKPASSRARPAAQKKAGKRKAPKARPAGARTVRVKLMDIAIARSGDKGADSNVGVMAKSPELYEFLRKTLTPARVKAHFRQICMGGVDRYELPNLRALNFILHDSLGGGGTETQKTDAQGKVHGLAMLHMELDVPANLLRG
jgi:hypothetical protein